VNSRLQAVATDYLAAEARLGRLVADAPAEWWPRRANPDRWSMAECVAHLNLVSAAFLPLLQDGLTAARRLGGKAPARYRRDPVGWLLWRTSGPPARHRLRTTAPFVPTSAAPLAELVSEFARLQSQQLACVREAEGLPLGRVKIVSPFDRRVRYNVYSCLTVLPRHQHRHLWQAEQVLEELRRGA
jgi:hypothetical protein